LITTARLKDESSEIPMMLRPMQREIVDEIHALAERRRAVETQLIERSEQSIANAC
jgi:hypothetical protein